jgi:transposase
MKDDVDMQEPVSADAVAEVASASKTQPRSTEVPTRGKRRTFPKGYKMKILAELEGCERGQTGGILRREGLYSSHIDLWRRQQKQGFVPDKKAHKANGNKALKVELAKAHRKAARLEKQLHQAECIIEIQKKVSSILGMIPREEEL